MRILYAAKPKGTLAIATAASFRSLLFEAVNSYKLHKVDAILNPYRPGAGNPPPVLSGRDDLLEQFRITLGRAKSGKPDKSVMPIGLRGVGKTVLLNRFVEGAEQQGFLTGTGVMEASEDGHFPELLIIRIRKILNTLDTLPSKAGRAVGKALGVLSSFSYSLPDGSNVKVGVAPIKGSADSGNLNEDLTEVLVACGEAARDHQRGILLAIDEVQYLSEQELGALITAVHRTAQLNLPVVLVGAGLPLLPGLAGNAKSYAERLFTFPRIGQLSGADARAAVIEPASKLDVVFSDEAFDEVMKATEGYPYFLQEWAHAAWNAAKGTLILRADVLGVQETVTQKLDDDFFRVRLDRLSRSEKAYMRAMAELGPGPHRSGDIAASYGAKAPTVAPLRANLIRKGMVWSPNYGDTAFTVPLFDRFLRRSLPFQQRS